MNQLDGLSPQIVAALKSPRGTTVDDIRARFPDTAADRYSTAHHTNAPPQHDREFRGRFDDACYSWQIANRWAPIPNDVRAQIAEQVRADIASERETRR